MTHIRVDPIPPIPGYHITIKDGILFFRSSLATFANLFTTFGTRSLEEMLIIRAPR